MNRLMTRPHRFAAVGLFAGALFTVPASAQDVDPAKWVGVWDLTYTANYSTCDNVDVGDARPAQLVVSVTKGVVKAVEQSANQEISMDAVAGSSDTLVLHSKSKKNDVGLELRLYGPGRRIIANADGGACAIVYDVKGKRRR
jgi:hypothetical protein